MGKFNRGDIVYIPFPFSDLSQFKVRPALVLATMLGNDIVLCEITSKPHADSYATSITQADFEWGGLPQNSTVRANILFTANQRLVLNTRGRLKREVIDEVVANLASLFGLKILPGHLAWITI